MGSWQRIQIGDMVRSMLDGGNRKSAGPAAAGASVMGGDFGLVSRARPAMVPAGNGSDSVRHATWILAASAAGLTAVPAPGGWFGGRDHREAVVQVHATIQREDYDQPWQPARPVTGSGSGVILRRRRILTNAHVISDARFIEVQREGLARRYPATVAFVGHDCDLAVLAVADPVFFEGVAPLDLADGLPDLNDEVVALGYPMGGKRLSLTRGVVSRIDYRLYTHSQVDSHLVLQIDAAINPGNSGGPVLFRDRVVGIAFQGIANAQNLGYAIPLPVIRHFLEDIEDGVYHGYPELGVAHLETPNPAMRRALGLQEPGRGVAVSRVDPYGSAIGVLEPGDVLLALDGHPIASDGTVQIEGQTVDYVELMERKQCGDRVRFAVWRRGAAREVVVPLASRPDPFALRAEYDRRPEYVIRGGLVFLPLTRGLLGAIGQDLRRESAQHLLYYAAFAKIDGFQAGRDQFVVLCQRLPHPVNAYLDGYLHRIVETVNGCPIRAMADLPGAFSQPSNGCHAIRFLDADDALVFDAAAAAAADGEILARYNIAEPMHLAPAGAAR